MIRVQRQGRLLLIGGALLLAVVAVRGTGRVSAANSPLGYVDVNRTIAEYKKAEEYAKSLDAFRSELQKQLSELEWGIFLDEGERNDLKTLLQKANLTQQEQAKLEALKKRNADTIEELKRLEAVAQPTPEQLKRRTALVNRLQAQNTVAGALNEKLSKQYSAKKQEMDERVRSEIQSAIDSVAAQQAVEIVLDKDAVLHGSKDKDLTDAVIAKLNAGGAQ